jgi:hypothetical protein
MGVPLFAGISISIGGFWDSYQYFKGGVPRSTLHHLTYNLIVVSVIALIMLLNGGSFH